MATMTTNQKKLLSKLKDEAKKLYIDGELEYLEKLNDIIMALTDDSTVLAVILAEIYKMPDKITNEIKKTFSVKNVS